MIGSPTTDKAARFAHRSSEYLANPLMSSPDQARRSKREDIVNQQRKKRNILTVAQRLKNITAYSHLASTSPSRSSSPSASSEGEDGHLGVASRSARIFTNEVDNLTGGINDLTVDPSDTSLSVGSKKKRPKGRRKGKQRDLSLSNVLTYAYLYPLPALKNHPDFVADGLPATSELTTDWLALSPIPRGKRCLCVSGPHGAPTSLHTRISARVLLRWASPLPAETILDCVLDDGWKFNGLIHVIDCLKWRGVDIASNEATFRVLFLQSRLSELSASSQLAQPPFKHPQRLIPIPVHGPMMNISAWIDLGKGLIDQSSSSSLPSLPSPPNLSMVQSDQLGVPSTSNLSDAERRQSKDEGILLIRSGTPYIFGDETNPDSHHTPLPDVNSHPSVKYGDEAGAGDIDAENDMTPGDPNDPRGEVGWVGRENVLDFIRRSNHL
ncbi:SNUPN, RNUT1 [Phaffia rhodozyma]|uniref:Snurportin-1 n=1 Tax=Phaffia rhodozyma TaxID=264483 RepID=A0A0F7SUC9_PHARH|nr:SNUPN, RNUT1 [Phaffia rhodozyma]